MSNTEKIRELNDKLRTTCTGGRIIITEGVLEQGDETVRQVLTLVKNFSEFSEDNDPYGEHDFGAINHNNIKYFWKIDYYDRTLSMHSPDATNPDVTVRVLTLFLAKEY